MSDEKKDLTSILDLSAMPAEHSDTVSSEGVIQTMPEMPKLSESDFVSLEEFSETTPELTSSAHSDSPPEILTQDPLDESGINEHALSEPIINQTETSTSEAIESMNSFEANSEEQNLNNENFLTEEKTPAVNELATQNDALIENSELNTPIADDPDQSDFSQEPINSSNNKSNLPEEPLVAAPPENSESVLKKSIESSKDLSNSKSILSNVTKVDANPAYSIKIIGSKSGFSEAAKQAIEFALGADDFGVRYKDIQIQIESGTVLIPRISEYAAILLAQKIYTFVEDIQINLSELIYKGKTDTQTDLVVLSSAEVFQENVELARDLASEPKKISDLFSTNLKQVEGFHITRILSTVTSWKVITKSIAEGPESTEFESATELLTRELLEKAFKLKAHGIVGVQFSILPLDSHTAYRLLGTATAVRGRKV